MKLMKSNWGLVAVLSLLMGFLGGSSVALAHTTNWVMQSGTYSYSTAIDDDEYDAHEGVAPDYSYDTVVTGRAENNFSKFSVNSVWHKNGDSEDSEVVFGLIYIWDAQGNNSQYYTDFKCLNVDGANIFRNFSWSYDELGGNNNGVGLQQYIWSSVVCPYDATGLGYHGTGIQIPD